MEFEVLFRPSGFEGAENGVTRNLRGRTNLQLNECAAFERLIIRRRAAFEVLTDLHSPFLNEKEIFTKIVIKRVDKGEPPA